MDLKLNVVFWLLVLQLPAWHHLFFLINASVKSYSRNKLFIFGGGSQNVWSIHSFKSLKHLTYGYCIYIYLSFLPFKILLCPPLALKFVGSYLNIVTYIERKTDRQPSKSLLSPFSAVYMCMWLELTISFGLALRFSLEKNDFPSFYSNQFCVFLHLGIGICGSFQMKISILQVMLLAVCFISDKIEVMLLKSSYLSQTRDNSIHAQQYLHWKKC